MKNKKNKTEKQLLNDISWGINQIYRELEGINDLLLRVFHKESFELTKDKLETSQNNDF